ncbi:hypothetical protein MMC24_001829 [Lignoscripta atroalba]|nr:hypothetical protein [Lignoscripta atroalba]
MPPAVTLKSAKRQRTSAFKEVDVDKFFGDEKQGPIPNMRPWRISGFRNNPDLHESSDDATSSGDESEASSKIRASPHKFTASVSTESASPPRAFSSMSRLFAFAFVIAFLVPLMQSSPLGGNAGYNTIDATAGLIPRSSEREREGVDAEIVKRQDSSTNYCTRWSHQTAIVNGTLYIYGGRSSQSSGQETDTWNNDLLALPLTETWQISSPTLKGLPKPSGPPPVANGYLWNSYDSLFLYGGEYSDKPATSPVPYALWQYDIASSSWKEHGNPQTSAGTNSEPENQPVQHAAEGAGISVPQLGRGWYFGGHLDGYTTAGWSQSVPRIYLKSFIEYTFPGYSNPEVESLSGGQPAGDDGAWRNITQGGLQDTASFTERADGVLVYVPGFGEEGIILGLAGGTNSSFTQLNVIDVYDVANSTWYKQTTDGTPPSIRVNPCAVAASAADGSSTNVYLFGGQNLIPYNEQIQYDDMWILTIPSFTWIKVDTEGQSVPAPRAGHSCNIWDGQIVVVGGYVGKDISCDSPGIYVFDASELKWQNQFTALTGSDTQNQQSSQVHNQQNQQDSHKSDGSEGSEDSEGLEGSQDSQDSQRQPFQGLSGSYGYQVPVPVQAIIGGQATGGATVTAPVVTATSGPLATGHAIIYTVTAANGAVVTETSIAGGGGGNSPAQKGRSGPNIGAIVAGVIAGLLAILAVYLGFCIWVYRRQLTLYKNHVAMSQRAAAGGPTEKTGFLFPTSSHEGSSDPSRGKYSTDRSSGPAGSATGTSGQRSDISSVPPLPGVHPPVGGNSTANSSTEDLMVGQEPSFVGVLLNPRRSLRVINRD